MSTMLVQPTQPEPNGAEVLRRLQSICRDRDLESLNRRLQDLALVVHADMAELERDLNFAPGARAVHNAAKHLIDLGGKRLRPICVALAARLGTGFDARARQLAVAVELVHNATLLHDDVVDLGDTRRGKPAPRMIWGNAVSIFAGDWLLVDALKRVRRAEVPQTLERLLDIIDEMIVAESIQLEGRGRLETTRETWMKVVEGKTAALFRWAMMAGGKAGGLGPVHIEALERYGLHLGIAFQAIDDVLDLNGDQQATGKALFTDLREGKMTYPLILALERSKETEPLLRAVLDAGSDDDAEDHRHFERILEILHRTDALDDCRSFAESQAALAIAAVGSLPAGRAADALITVAEATVTRRA